MILRKTLCDLVPPAATSSAVGTPRLYQVLNPRPLPRAAASPRRTASATPFTPNRVPDGTPAPNVHPRFGDGWLGHSEAVPQLLALCAWGPPIQADPVFRSSEHKSRPLDRRIVRFSTSSRRQPPRRPIPDPPVPRTTSRADQNRPLSGRIRNPSYMEAGGLSHPLLANYFEKNRILASFLPDLRVGYGILVDTTGICRAGPMGRYPKGPVVRGFSPGDRAVFGSCG